ncbi:MAG: thioredoxin family protein [bacterium]
MDSVWKKFWNEGFSPDSYLEMMSSPDRIAQYRSDIAAYNPSEEAKASISSWPSGIKVGIITEEWCGDAANFVPAFLKLFSLRPEFEVKLFARDEFPELRDAHLTGGKAKIPVVVVLDAEWNELGRFVERPAAQNRWLSEALAPRKWPELTEDEKAEWKAKLMAKGRELRDAAVWRLLCAVSQSLGQSELEAGC